MITLFDSHAHLNSKKFADDRKDVLKRARESGVQYILNVSDNVYSCSQSIKLTQEESGIYASLGVHPHEAKSFTAESYALIESLAETDKVAAVGETGLDYYYEHSSREVQKEAFRKHIELARKLDLPLIVHNREAHRDTLQTLKEMKAEEVGGVMHCFSGDEEIAREALKLGFYISLGGPVTFKNAKKTQQVAEMIPQEKLLIETDCPYLSPEPKRGRRNEPAHVVFVAQKIAEIRGESLEKVAEHTTMNAKRLFRIND